MQMSFSTVFSAIMSGVVCPECEIEDAEVLQ
jgi:hypothetical protein